MEDESIFTKNESIEISEGLQHFIDSMVEEIVLEGKPFDTQKKYLKKFSEREELDYDKLEAGIIAFLELLESFQTSYNDHQVKQAEEKGRQCHISEGAIKKLVAFSSQPKSSKKEKSIRDRRIGTRRFSSKQKIILYCAIGLAAIGLIFFCWSNIPRTDESEPKPIHHTDTVVMIQRDTLLRKDTVLKVLHDTIVVMQYSTEAERMYREKAEQGDRVAQFNLACHYDGGTRGLVQNYAEAVKWYRLSANQGYPQAQNNLGYCYEKGHGVPQSLQEAKMWYKKAADQGNSKAKANLESLEKQTKAPQVAEWTIPAPSWNGKTLQGEPKDKFQLREVKKRSKGGWQYDNRGEWLKENGLHLEYTSYNIKNKSSLEDAKKQVDLSVFPPVYRGDSLLFLEIRNDFCSAFYGGKFLCFNRLMTFDVKKSILYKMDFSSFLRAPYTKPGEENYVNQGMSNPIVVKNVLYVQHGHLSYARSSKGKNAYISAIDLNNGHILWTTSPLTCNGDFIIVDNTIICGYGYSEEADYLYLVDMATGKRRQAIKVGTAPERIVRKGNQIFVLTYGEQYVYDIVR